METNLRGMGVGTFEDVPQRGLASLGHQSARRIGAAIRGNIMAGIEASADQLVKAGARVDVLIVWGKVVYGKLVGARDVWAGRLTQDLGRCVDAGRRKTHGRIHMDFSFLVGEDCSSLA
jgi:hypothetical protein